MIKPKGVATIMAIILISVCGWVAIVHFVLAPNMWVGSALSFSGGAAIGGGVAYLMRRWWFKWPTKSLSVKMKGGGPKGLE